MRSLARLSSAAAPVCVSRVCLFTAAAIFASDSATDNSAAAEAIAACCACNCPASSMFGDPGAPIAVALPQYSRANCSADAPASIVTLQKELRPGDADLLARHPRITQLGDALATLDDTAAAIAALDLVISVDTAVAHVAGALGKPLFLLLPFAADFRWLRERSDSPWYPTARLFRQPRFGDWASVVDLVRAEITQTFGQNSASSYAGLTRVSMLTGRTG